MQRPRFGTQPIGSCRPLALSRQRGSVSRRDLKAKADDPVSTGVLATDPDMNLYLIAFAPHWTGRA